MSRRPVAPPPKQRSGTGRTVVLVAVASILAGLIIGRGLSNKPAGSTGSSTPKTDSSGNTTATTKKPAKGATTTSSTTPAPTTTAAPAVTLSNFTAIVLNGNGISGTAGARTGELAALGVKTIKAADATVKTYDTSVIYAVTPEAEAAARLLATKSGIPYGNGYPTASPPAPVEKLGTANIVLLLGKDWANKVITDLTAGGAAAATTTVAGNTTTTKK